MVPVNGRFDLDDTRAHVREQERAKATGDMPAEVEHADARKHASVLLSHQSPPPDALRSLRLVLRSTTSMCLASGFMP
jgi:hypothetical protein